MNILVSMELAELPLRLAQLGNGGGQSSPLGPFLMVGALMLVFYAFIIRPQRQQEKQQGDMRAGLQRGDQVVTTGGIHGKITGLSDDIVTVEIADRVRVKVSRSAIVSSRGQASASSGEGKA